MAIFLDPQGHSSFGIALCGRCSRKFPLDELYPDPNTPGLMVCREDLDEYDPYRLPARPTEDITLPFTRPDTPLLDRQAPYPDFFHAIRGDDGRFVLTEKGEYLYTEDKPQAEDDLPWFEE